MRFSVISVASVLASVSCAAPVANEDYIMESADVAVGKRNAIPEDSIGVSSGGGITIDNLLKRSATPKEDSSIGVLDVLASTD